MVYMLTLGVMVNVNIYIYSIHGSYGYIHIYITILESKYPCMV